MTFRFIDPFDAVGSTFTDAREPNTHNFVNDLQWFKGAHSLKVGTNIRFSRVPKERFQSSYLSATINPSWVAGIGRRNMPGSAFCTVARLLGASGGGRRRSGRLRRRVAQHPRRRLAVDAARQLRPRRRAAAARHARSRGRSPSDEYEFYVQDSWQLRSNLTLTAGVRYGLSSPPYEVNGLQVAPTISMGEWFDAARRQHEATAFPSNAQPTS